LLQVLVRRGGSDLHLSPGAVPRFRVDGRLAEAEGEALSAEVVEAMISAGLPDRYRALLEDGGEADYAFTLTGVARFRGSVFRCRGALAAVYRTVAGEVPSLDALGLPASAAGLAGLGSGLVLTAGPVGSGKSTTMAAIVDRINRTRAVHIVTVEDPVELIHRNRRALITQRQVGSDTASFHSALRSVLRSDPDVVVIGEIRDRETVDAALRVSETGHLALATMHARSALHALTRIVELFPASQHRQARIRLSASLETIYCQRLVPRADGRGRVLAVERLVPTPAARNLIREDKLHQLFAVMDAGAGRGTTVSLNEALASLCRQGIVTRGDALAASNEAASLAALLGAATNGRA
jgi:twitching motility protein PilT